MSKVTFATEAQVSDRIKLTPTLSKTIKTGREERNLTQSALALKAKVPRARVKRIENMELNTVDVFEVERLIQVLGVHLPLKKVAQDSLPKKKKATKKKTARSKTQKSSAHGVLIRKVSERLNQYERTGASKDSSLQEFLFRPLPMTKKLAKAIKEARVNGGITQSDLADRLNISRGRMKRMENGELQTIEFSELERLIRVLDFPLGIGKDKA